MKWPTDLIFGDVGKDPNGTILRYNLLYVGKAKHKTVLSRVCLETFSSKSFPRISSNVRD